MLYVMMTLQRGFPIHLALMVWAVSGAGTAAITRPVIAAFEPTRVGAWPGNGGHLLTGMIVPPILAATIGAYGWRAGLYDGRADRACRPPLALALIGRRAKVERGHDEVAGRPVAAGQGPHVTRRSRSHARALLVAGPRLAAVNIPALVLLGTWRR